MIHNGDGFAGLDDLTAGSADQIAGVAFLNTGGILLVQCFKIGMVAGIIGDITFPGNVSAIILQRRYRPARVIAGGNHAGKGIVRNAGGVALKTQGIQLAAVGEGISANLCHRIRHIDGGDDRGIGHPIPTVEQIGRNPGTAICKNDFNTRSGGTGTIEGLAVQAIVLRNVIESGALDRDFGHVNAFLECPGTQGRKLFRQGNRLKCVAAPESALCNFCYCVRECNVLQLCTSAKSILCDRCQIVRERNFLQAGTIMEGIFPDIGDTISKIHGLQIGTALERASSNPGYGIRHGNRGHIGSGGRTIPDVEQFSGNFGAALSKFHSNTFRSRADTVERLTIQTIVFRNVIQAGSLNRNFCYVDTLLESAGTQSCKLCGKCDGFKAAAAPESPLCNLRQRLWESHILQLRTSVKCIFCDGGQVIGQCNGLQIFRTLERILTNIGDTIAKVHGFQIHALLERVSTHPGHSIRHGNRGDIGCGGGTVTGMEESSRHSGAAFFKDHFNARPSCTGTVEGLAIQAVLLRNIVQRGALNRNLGNVGTILESAGPQVGQLLRQCNRFQGRTGLESILPNVGQRLGKIHILQVGTIAEGIIMNCGQLRRQGKGFQIGTALECIFADPGHTVCQGHGSDIGRRCYAIPGMEQSFGNPGATVSKCNGNAVRSSTNAVERLTVQAVILRNIIQRCALDGNFGYIGTALECTRTKIHQLFRQRNGFHGRTSPESTFPDVRQNLGELHILERRTIVECICRNGRKLFGQGHRFQTGAALECRIAHPGHGVCHGNRGDVGNRCNTITSMEQPLGNSGTTFFKRNLDTITADANAVERLTVQAVVLRNIIQGCALDGNFGYIGTALECTRAKVYQLFRQRNRFEGCTGMECFFSNIRQGFGKLHILERRAVAESIRRDSCKLLRECYGFQIGTALECIVAHPGHGIRHGNRGNIGSRLHAITGIEQSLRHSGAALGKLDSNTIAGSTRATEGLAIQTITLVDVVQACALDYNFC